MQIEDTRYSVVQTSSGKIRLGSLDASSILEYLGSDPSDQESVFRLIAKSIVDEGGSRLKNVDTGIRALRRRDSRVVVKLKEAVIRLNDIPLTDEAQKEHADSAKRRLRADPLRLFAHRLASERGIVNVDEMLRSISFDQLRELQAYGEVEFFGETRTDIRFAILASVMAGAQGAKATDGTPYTAHNFLEALHISDRLANEAKQSQEEIEKHLLMWIDGANRVFHERRHGVANAA